MTPDELRKREVVKLRQSVAGSFAAGSDIAAAFFTAGLSLLTTPLAMRRVWIAEKKLQIVKEELTRQNLEHYEPKIKDYLIATGAGIVGTALTGGVDIGASHFTSLAATQLVSDHGVNAVSDAVANPTTFGVNAVHGVHLMVEQAVQHSTAATGVENCAIITGAPYADPSAIAGLNAGMALTKTAGDKLIGSACDRISTSFLTIKPAQRAQTSTQRSLNAQIQGDDVTKKAEQCLRSSACDQITTRMAAPKTEPSARIPAPLPSSTWTHNDASGRDARALAHEKNHTEMLDASHQKYLDSVRKEKEAQVSSPIPLSAHFQERARPTGPVTRSGIVAARKNTEGSRPPEYRPDWVSESSEWDQQKPHRLWQWFVVLWQCVLVLCAAVSLTPLAVWVVILMWNTFDIPVLSFAVIMACLDTPKSNRLSGIAYNRL